MHVCVCVLVMVVAIMCASLCCSLCNYCVSCFHMCLPTIHDKMLARSKFDNCQFFEPTFTSPPIVFLHRYMYA